MAAKGKRITKVSKFDGFKPGWVFKTGDQGLGYYRDSGGMRMQVSLDLALRPMRSLPAATIILDDLAISSDADRSKESGERSLAPVDEVAPPKLREPRGTRPGVAASKSAIWKLAAQATAVYLGANVGIHNFATNPTAHVPTTTRAARQTVSTFEAVANSLPDRPAVAESRPSSSDSTNISGFSPPPGLVCGSNDHQCM